MKSIFQLIDVNESSWAETIRLYSGLLEGNERKSFLIQLSNYDILLSAECLTYSILDEKRIYNYICKKARSNIQKNLTFKEVKSSILALVELQHTNYLSKAILQIYDQQYKNIKTIISAICLRSQNKFLIEILKRIHGDITDEILMHFIINSSILKSPFIKDDLLKIRSFEFWLNLVNDILNDPQNLASFNSAMYIIEVFNISDRFDFEFITDILLKEDNIRNSTVRCFFEYLNIVKDQDKPLSKASILLPSIVTWKNELKFSSEEQRITKPEMLYFFLKTNFFLGKEYKISRIANLIKIVNGLGSYKKNARTRKRRSSAQSKLYQVLSKSERVYLTDKKFFIFEQEITVELAKALLNYNDELVIEDNDNMKTHPEFSEGDLIVCRIEEIFKTHAIALIEGSIKGRIYIGDIRNKYVGDIHKELKVGERVVAVVKKRKGTGFYDLSMKDVFKN